MGFLSAFCWETLPNRAELFHLTLRAFTDTASSIESECAWKVQQFAVCWQGWRQIETVSSAVRGGWGWRKVSGLGVRMGEILGSRRCSRRVNRAPSVSAEEECRLLFQLSSVSAASLGRGLHCRLVPGSRLGQGAPEAQK